MPKYFNELSNNIPIMSVFFFLQKSKKKKKEKRSTTKDKKLKKEKKKRDKEKRNEYEEPEGITTPSKENLSISQIGTPMETKLPVSGVIT